MAEGTKIDWATVDEETLEMAANEFIAMYAGKMKRRLHFSLSDLERAGDEFLVRYGPAKALARTGRAGKLED